MAVLVKVKSGHTGFDGHKRVYENTEFVMEDEMFYKYTKESFKKDGTLKPVDQRTFRKDDEGNILTCQYVDLIEENYVAPAMPEKAVASGPKPKGPLNVPGYAEANKGYAPKEAPSEVSKEAVKAVSGKSKAALVPTDADVI